MKASDAIDGGRYRIPARGLDPMFNNAVCNGWNYTKEWLLFVVYDAQGKRKIKLVMPTEDIQAID